VTLAGLDYETIDGMFQLWKKRPKKKGSNERVAKKSAEHYVSALKGFLRWLNVNPRYEWRKPEGIEDINTRVQMLETDRRRQVTDRDVFTLDELILLNRYATPLERLFLLLGINCGFGRAEIGSLLVGEVFLREPHDERFQNALAYQGAADDSFAKRIRRKTGVYGEHLLFPQTVEGIKWALRRRRRFPKYGENARLLLNKKGEPYDKLTKGGNPNQQIPNRFSDLLRRVRDNDKKIRSLSFGNPCRFRICHANRCERIVCNTSANMGKLFADYLEQRTVMHRHR